MEWIKDTLYKAKIAIFVNSPIIIAIIVALLLVVKFASLPVSVVVFIIIAFLLYTLLSNMNSDNLQGAVQKL